MLNAGLDEKLDCKLCSSGWFFIFQHNNILRNKPIHFFIVQYRFKQQLSHTLYLLVLFGVFAGFREYLSVQIIISCRDAYRIPIGF